MAIYKLVTDKLLQCLKDIVGSIKCSLGQPNGIATLDDTGNVPADQLANASGGGGQNMANADLIADANHETNYNQFSWSLKNAVSVSTKANEIGGNSYSRLYLDTSSPSSPQFILSATPDDGSNYTNIIGIANNGNSTTTISSSDGIASSTILINPTKIFILPDGTSGHSNGEVLTLIDNGTGEVGYAPVVGGVASVFTRTGAVTAQSGDYTFAQIGSTPTTISGYGIIDGATLTGVQTLTNKVISGASNTLTNIAESSVTNLVSDLAAKQATITLTTTGTSGAATLVGATLNVPQYTGGTLQQVTTNGNTSTNPIYLNVTAPTVAQTVHYFGDSVTSGVAASPTSNRWTTILSSLWGVTESNHGISSSTLEKQTPLNPFGATNMVDNVGNIPTYTTAMKYLVFAYGINDVGYNATNYNTTNFTTDYTTVINNALGKGWPANKIVLISPYYLSNPSGYVSYAGTSGTPQTDPTRLAAFVAATAALATSLSTLYVDINAAEAASYGNSLISYLDGIHPNNDGHRFIAQYIYNALQAPITQNSQALAVSGLVQLNQLKFSSLNYSQSISSLVGLDYSGNLVMADTNGYIKNNISSTPGVGSINLLGSAYFGNVVSPTTVDVLQVNGSIKGSLLRATGTAPSGLTGTGVEVAHNGTIGFLYAYNRTGSAATNLAISSLGGSTLFGTTTPTGGPEIVQINGGISGNFGRFTTSVSGTGLTGSAAEIGLSSSTAFLYGYNRTGGAGLNLCLGFGLSPFIVVGSNTVTGTAPFQVNSNSYISGTLGVGVSAATAILHLKAGTATASTAPLKLTSGTSLTTAENGAIEYDGTNFYATPAGAVRQQFILQKVTTDATTSLTLALTTTTYVFTGSSATVWTLPAVSGNTNKTYYIKNRGSAVITLTRAGSDNLYTSSAVTTLTINPGDGYEIICDGTYWLVL